MREISEEFLDRLARERRQREQHSLGPAPWKILVGALLLAVALLALGAVLGHLWVLAVAE